MTFSIGMGARSFSIHISSSQSSQVYPTNKPYSFYVDLPYPIHFSGRWICELQSVYTTQRPTTTQCVCIHAVADFVKTSITYDTDLSVLATFGYRTYQSPSTITLKAADIQSAVLHTHMIQRIHIQFLTNTLQLCDFFVGDTVVSLKFSKVHNA